MADSPLGVECLLHMIYFCVTDSAWFSLVTESFGLQSVNVPLIDDSYNMQSRNVMGL